MHASEIETPAPAEPNFSTADTKEFFRQSNEKFILLMNTLSSGQHVKGMKNLKLCALQIDAAFDAFCVKNGIDRRKL